jgi:hypothetical protein
LVSVFAGVVGVAVVVVVVVLVLDDDESLDELELLALDPPALLLELLPYPSEYQPPPFRMKLPLTIWRRACSFPQSEHFLMGSSLMRCSSSNVPPHPSHK